MCKNHPARTSPWLILAHQCTYYNIACLPANLSEDHTAVSGFRGSTSIATHRGDFKCVLQNARLIHLVDPSAALVIPDSHRNLFPCDTLNNPAKLSYWEPKQDCYHMVIQISSFHSSKTNLLASGFYLYCHHRRHTLVSTSSLPQPSDTTATPALTVTTSIKHKSRQR